MNFVITFGLLTPMKKFAMIFRDKTEDEVRDIASKYFRDTWAGIYSESKYNTTEMSEELTLLESGV